MKKRRTIKAGAFDRVRDFIAEHPQFLFIVANPGTDEILTSYAGKAAFVRFPEGSHVVLRVVSEDMFELSIDDFATGMLDVLKKDEQESAQFIKAVGGAIRSIGTALNIEHHGTTEEK